jgi:1-acyl-sn-glycerol-3-phosphate acyltransferase
VLVVANHPNSLVDPLVVFRIGGRVSRPMAKAPLFDHALLGPVLRALGGLPVYRRQDDPSQMNKNEGTFDAAVAALRAGEAVQIFPEGKTHSDPALAPIRTGAARIALRAEEEAAWDLGLQIVPVGLTYRRKAVAGGSVVAQTGRPLVPAELRALYEDDPQEAVRRLTDQISQALEKLTLNFAESEDRELVEVAERMYAREKGLTAWRTRQSLGDRLPRLRQFARGLAWLRANDPERHRRVTDAVRRYAKLLGVLGAGDAEIPRRYRTRKVLWYIVTKGIVLGLTMPVALAGIVLWWIPYHLPRLAVGRMRPAYEAVSTIKLATVILAFPACDVVVEASLGRRS